MHVRVCRNCGEEYRPEIQVCTDCGGALEDRDDAFEAPPQPEALAAGESAPPLGPARWLCWTETAAEMDPLAERLAAAHIPYAVRVRHGVHLLVPEEHLEVARTVLQLPAAPAELDPEATGQCPACQTALAPGAAGCPECGLSLGPLSSCSRCGATLEAFATACTACGFQEP